MRVSVICTVLNEAASIGTLLDSLLAQTRPPDEVVIVDGGSRDGTQGVILSYAGRLPIRLQEARGANISQGRNLAVRRAGGELIASTDAGVRLDPQWLANLLAPLEAPDEGVPPPQAVAGFFLPAPQSTFELALAATTLPLLADVDPRTFLPSSRSVAFRRDAFQQSGGYPEWLDYCEDLILDFRLLDTAGPFAWAPEAIAYFRPRSSLRAFFRQYYRYARGDGKADLWRKRHLVRYATYLLALPGLLLLGVLHSALWLIPLALGGGAYCWRPLQRLRALWQEFNWPQRLAALALIPVIRATGDLAKMAGYPAGLRWRRSNRHRPELHWRKDSRFGRG